MKQEIYKHVNEATFHIESAIQLCLDNDLPEIAAEISKTLKVLNKADFDLVQPEHTGQVRFAKNDSKR